MNARLSVAVAELSRWFLGKETILIPIISVMNVGKNFDAMTGVRID
jgi:hypothetical protein